MLPQSYFEKVKKYFHDDDQKTWEWFQTTHYHLGMLSPLNAIKLGRQQKVMNLIDKYMKQTQKGAYL